MQACQVGVSHIMPCRCICCAFVWRVACILPRLPGWRLQQVIQAHLVLYSCTTTEQNSFQVASQRERKEDLLKSLLEQTSVSYSLSKLDCICLSHCCSERASPTENLNALIPDLQKLLSFKKEEQRRQRVFPEMAQSLECLCPKS